MTSRATNEVCADLASRLRERRPELEAAVSTRFYAISDPREMVDPTYLPGLHSAIGAFLDYAFTFIELGEQRAPDVPPALLVEARLAARSGISVETVLQRYFAGNAILGDFLTGEAERTGVGVAGLRDPLRRQAALFERLIAAVSAEHTRETNSWPNSDAERRREWVKGLLAGELVDRSKLDYDLEAHHLALMAKGEGAPEAMRALAEKLGRRLLAVRHEEEPAWACWLGGANRLEAERALRALGEIPLDPRLVVTVGEPGEGLPGWRFSHRQAKAALPIAERRGQPVLRYADVALVASILRDDLIATSLHQLYLAPLESSRDHGEAAKATLRAYFAAERNVSSTAAALGVDRRTVTNRIRVVEDIFGRPLKDFANELETALGLGD